MAKNLPTALAERRANRIRQGAAPSTTTRRPDLAPYLRLLLLAR